MKKIVVVFSVLLLIIIIKALNVPFPQKENNLVHYADQLITQCKNELNKISCYDYAIPELMDPPANLSFEQAFEVIKLIQKKDDRYWFCHDAGHKISYKEYLKDPSKWQDIMTRCEVGMCANGCLHGSLQAHFSTNEFSQDQLNETIAIMKNICEARPNWKPTNGQRSICYHELGHLTLYVTNVDIAQAGRICDVIGVKEDGYNFLQTCYEGIFMQIFEPREPEDFSLIYNIVPEKEKLKGCGKYTRGVDKGACWKGGWKGKTSSFCDQFSEGLRGACYREAWVINDDLVSTPEGIVTYCSYSEDENEQRKCFNKIFISLFTKNEFDVEEMKEFCLKMPSRKGQCFADIAVRMLSTDKQLSSRAADLCIFAAKQNIGDQCFRDLIDMAQFYHTSQSKELLDLCSTLPEKWKAICSS